MKTTRLATVALIGALAAGAHLDVGGQADALVQGHQDQGQMLAQTRRSKQYTSEYQNRLAREELCPEVRFRDFTSAACYKNPRAWGVLMTKWCFDGDCSSPDYPATISFCYDT